MVASPALEPKSPINDLTLCLVVNPRGFGWHVALDVAVTAVDGQSRMSDEAADRPLNARYEQKMVKYHRLPIKTVYIPCPLSLRTLVKLISPLSV